MTDTKRWIGWAGIGVGIGGLVLGTWLPPLLYLGLLGCAGLHGWALWTSRTTEAASPAGGAGEMEQPDTLTSQLMVTSDELTRAVQAINDVVHEQANGAQEQVLLINQTRKLLNEFLTLADRVREQARSVRDVSSGTAETAATGQASIEASLAVMESIREQVVLIAETIATLANLTRRIETIITSVGEIATQSNLLALNASIEAARAGEQGRGFAVVADEVRDLAKQSTTASGQVRTLLREVQNAITETINATEAGMTEVTRGVRQARLAGATIREIAKEVGASNEATHEIFNAIRQQTEGMETITINVERINHVTQSNAEGMQVVRTVSNNLLRLSDQLERVVKADVDETADEETTA